MNKIDKKIMLPVAIAIVLLVTLFAYISLTRVNTKKEETQVKPLLINEYANSPATVSYLVVGQINSNEAHRAIRITVSNNSRLVEVLSGYQYIPINSKSYDNTIEAFKPFLASLQVAGFTVKKTNPRITNPEGICPFGNRYFFTSTGIPEIPDNLWSTSCSSISVFGGGSSAGTFDGNVNTVQTLFQNQIPDYNTITQNVQL